MRPISTQRGMTLIELLLAMAISAIIMASLNGIVKLGLDAQTAGRGSNELAYQGRFALERISDKARSLTPKVLSTTAANTTGNWFAPTGCTGTACVMSVSYTHLDVYKRQLEGRLVRPHPRGGRRGQGGRPARAYLPDG